MWLEICPWDENGEDLQTFVNETNNTDMWGGGLQIQIFAKTQQCKIMIHHPGNAVYEFGEGPEHHLLYHGANETTSGTHYDFLHKIRNDDANPEYTNVGIQTQTTQKTPNK